jgi:hypothetical protein
VPNFKIQVFMKKFISVLIFISAFFTTNAQVKYTLSGLLKDASSGELLIGASVTVAEKRSVGVISNEYGFYSVALPKGIYTFKVGYVGYTAQELTINLDSNTVLNWALTNKKLMEEVVVSTSSRRKTDNLTKAIMGTEVLNMKDIAKIPVIFGEKDIIKTLQLLPGIKSSGEGANGFSVRGGATDQNLILLDEAPVYNASHLLGFFSTFNSDAIKDATIIKGNSPAQYGGRLASVLDVKMKDGNNKTRTISGGIGTVSSRFTYEAPIQKDKSSFIISGRRTYADIFLKASKDLKDTKLYFYDLNAKANYYVNKKNRLYFSAYFGRDVLAFGETFGTNWGNATATLRWNNIINTRLFVNTSVIYSNYDLNTGIQSGTTKFNINSNITDFNIKQDYTYFANPKNAMRFGVNVIHHSIKPNTFSGTVTNEDLKTGRKGIESAVYFNNVYKATDEFTVDYGLRASAYTLLGGDTYRLYNNGIKYDSVVLAKGKFGKTYFNLEPRLTLNYRLNQTSSVKASYSRNTQNLHLMSNSTSGNPTDQWLGNSYNTKPEIADQIALGFSKNFNDNNYEWNTEVYYKDMQNQVDFKNGADVNTAPDIESELLYGKGRAYGIELLLKKKAGKLTGWVGYTLSKTERKINGINNNNWYNAKQDRTHDLSIVGVYQLNEKWSLAGTFIYNTGNAVTFPTGKYSLNGQTVFEYSNRNADRMPANHRLDFSATYEPKKKGKVAGTWNFSLYNVYGRENAYTITFRDGKDNPNITEAVQTSLFRWVPSVTYNFKF